MTLVRGDLNTGDGTGAGREALAMAPAFKMVATTGWHLWLVEKANGDGIKRLSFSCCDAVSPIESSLEDGQEQQVH
ncbi:hypothetical protein chiPu_0017865 [Chiloscyllium punctatum]|uniref:Uncharacterized protein n=1 Tax=Chiloscyllium punctatum TaxID=137246 RepID=A0A401RJF0_CHIPU|nr:hypothetical protein [Chiloscyllium punctatum]